MSNPPIGTRGSRHSNVMAAHVTAGFWVQREEGAGTSPCKGVRECTLNRCRTHPAGSPEGVPQILLIFLQDRRSASGGMGARGLKRSHEATSLGIGADVCGVTGVGSATRQPSRPGSGATTKCGPPRTNLDSRFCGNDGRECPPEADREFGGVPQTNLFSPQDRRSASGGVGDEGG